ncbi:MAG: hypothetical protein R3Y32_00860 [Bacillota bacterium]
MASSNNSNNSSEFGYQVPENSNVLEYQDVTCEEAVFAEADVGMATEYPQVESEENLSQSENSSTAQENSQSSKITVGVAAVCGVAILAFSIVSGGASFSKFDVYGTSVDFTLDTSIEYVIQDTSIFDYDNFDTNLRMITYSDSTDNVDMVYLDTGNESLQTQVEIINSTSDGGEIDIAFSGRIEGLFEGTTYTTQVVGEDENGNIQVYAEKTYTTTGAQTFFSEVAWECNCRIDGCFYFTMNYLDESEYYGNFYYRMISSDTHEVFSEGEISNPKETQCVNVERAVGMDYILEISFESTAPIDIENGETSKVYQIDVKI